MIIYNYSQVNTASELSATMWLTYFGTSITDLREEVVFWGFILHSHILELLQVKIGTLPPGMVNGPPPDSGL